MSEKRIKTLMNLSLIIAIIGGGFMVYRFPDANSSVGKIMNFGGLAVAAVMFILSRMKKGDQEEEE